LSKVEDILQTEGSGTRLLVTKNICVAFANAGGDTTKMLELLDSIV